MHKCRTYFNITSEKTIEIEVICNELSIEKKDVSLSIHLNSTNIGNNDEYDVDINKMLRKTLVNLIGKEMILMELKSKYNFTYYLERVVELDPDSDEPKPILSLDRDIIEFLYKTETIDDLDYYV